MLVKLRTQLLGNTPLRTLLISSFVLQILSVVGLVGYLSFRAGQKSVNDLANQLQDEISVRVQQKLDAYLSIPPLINQININAFDSGMLAIDEAQKIEDFFYQQVQTFESISYIFISNNRGAIIAPGRRLDGSFVLEKNQQV